MLHWWMVRTSGKMSQNQPWASRWQMSLSVDKYKGIHLEKNNLDHIYTMQSQEPIVITQESDAGNITDTIDSVCSGSGKKKS